MATKKILVAGMTNVGKTSLAFTLARFLGVNKLHLTWQDGSKKGHSYKYNLVQAKQRLVNDSEFHTKGLYTISIDLSKLTRLQIIDSTGLTDEVHPGQEIRQCMAMTITALADCDCLLHVMDSEYYYDKPPSDVDRELANAAGKAKYIPVANKIDSPKSSIGLHRIEQLAGDQVHPCSCVTGQGIVAVRQTLLGQLRA